jgi:hypothetical protein
MTDALARLRAAGVSVWLDDLSPERLTSGSLAALARDRGDVVQVLEDQGVTTFDASWDHLGQREALRPATAPVPGDPAAWMTGA